MAASLAEFQEAACRDVESSIAFLQQRRLLSTAPPMCTEPGCPRQMTVFRGVRRIHKDRRMWRCPSHKGTKLSIRHGSIFQQSHLSLPQLLRLLFYWALNIPVKTACELTSIARQSVGPWYRAIRMICGDVINHLHPAPLLGGPGVIVQIDESVISKPKNNRGRRRRPTWMFGAYCPAQRLGFAEIVPNRTAFTLLPIILRTIAPGSMIHSDMWAAYRRIRFLHGNAGQAFGVMRVRRLYNHQTVNHRRNFVDPATGAHTQHIECFWNNVKSKRRSLRGVRRQLMQEYLNEFMWRHRFGATGAVALDNIILHMSQWNPVH